VQSSARKLYAEVLKKLSPSALKLKLLNDTPDDVLEMDNLNSALSGEILQKNIQ